MESDTIYGPPCDGSELVAAAQQQQQHVWRWLARWFGAWDCSLVQTASTLLHWQNRWEETLHLHFSTLIFCTERRWRTRLIKTVSGAIRHTQPRLDLKFRFPLSDSDSESLFIPPGGNLTTSSWIFTHYQLRRTHHANVDFCHNDGCLLCAVGLAGWVIT